MYIEKKVAGVAALNTNWKWFPSRVKAAVLAFVWPRIDSNVTKSVNHLLKCPYSVHATTDRLCVPVPFQEGLFSMKLSTMPTSKMLHKTPELRRVFADTLALWWRYIHYGHYHDDPKPSAPPKHETYESKVVTDVEDLIPAAKAVALAPEDFVLPGDWWVVRLDRLFFLNFNASTNAASLVIVWRNANGENSSLPLITHTTTGEFRLKGGCEARMYKSGTDFGTRVATRMKIQTHANKPVCVWADGNIKVLKPLARYQSQEQVAAWANTFINALQKERKKIIDINVNEMTHAQLKQELNEMYVTIAKRVVVL